MLKDLRHAIRLLFQAKGWTLVVVLSLALGIGANTALFSAINGLLLTKIPVRDPDTLVRFRFVGRNDMVTSSSGYGFLNKAAYGDDVRAGFSFPMYQQFVADNRTMTDLVAGAPFGRVNVVADGRAEVANSFIATGNFFRVLGVTARIGRTIVAEDDTATAPPVAVISSPYWHSRFGTDPNVLGKTIRVNNAPLTIVGVLDPEFTGIQLPVGEPPDITIPMSHYAQFTTDTNTRRLTMPTNWWLEIMGRLKPGVTPAQVQANLETVFQNTARAGLDTYLKSISDEERASVSNRTRTRVPHLRVEPGARGIYDVSSSDLRSVTILSVVVALVLLIVCANVANLLLSRATTRQKELSVRMSLGATRWRLIRQLLTESLVLAALGGALGIVIGYWGRQLLPGMPGQAAATLDLRSLAFVLLITAATGIIFGIAPALRGTGVNVNSALKETSRGVVGTRSILGKALLIVQVAVSLVLLVGAGLFLRTLHNLQQVNVGFNPENLLLFRVSPQLNRYDEPRMAILYQNMMRNLAAVPGVRGVAMSSPALLAGSLSTTGIYVQGHVYPVTREPIDNSINRLVVSESFFDVMGIPVVLGRGFTERDKEKAPGVAIVNETAARKYFGNVNPIGRRFGFSVEKPDELEVVGVLRDAKYDSIRDAVPPTMYVPYLQNPRSFGVFEVRTAGNPAGVTASVREAMRQIDPNMPILDVSTQMEQIGRRMLQEKVFAQAYSLFGGLALLLASIGLFGVMSYNVSRRTNEIGIRMALGAQRQDVLQLVMRESMILVVVGVVAGLVVALAAGRFVETLLFGLAATDVMTMVLAIGVMALVSAFAGYLPARRASRVDPMVALHYE